MGCMGVGVVHPCSFQKSRKNKSTGFACTGMGRRRKAGEAEQMATLSSHQHTILETETDPLGLKFTSLRLPLEWNPFIQDCRNLVSCLSNRDVINKVCFMWYEQEPTK